jgi:MFS superfamily sulfate permease-like transporter
MGISVPLSANSEVELSRREATGAIGDSVTVLPIVVAVAVLTDLSLAVMLVWFGVFQVVWGLHYGVPVSVEPMKAVAALVVAGGLTTGELLVAGLLLAGVLLVVGWTGSLARVGRYVGSPVVRGVQFGVALMLLRTGVDLAGGDLRLAAVAVGVAAAVTAAGHRDASGLAVLLVGGAVAASSVGLPSPALPPADGLVGFGPGDLTAPAVEAAAAQLAMTLGNAALATSVLLADYFDRDVSADQLTTSMGLMNLVAVPFGALPMCHGSGGVAGKYAFGARTAGANVVLGVGYVLVALFAVGLVAAYPLPMLGAVLALVALQLGRTSLRQADPGDYLLVAGVGVCGLVVNLGVAFVAGVALSSLRQYAG